MYYLAVFLRTGLKRYFYLYLVVPIGFLGMLSCSEESDCFSENTASITIEFFRLNTLDPDTSFYEEDTLFLGSLNSVYVVGNRDSVIIENDTIVGQLTLPVDPRVDTTAYVIGRNNLTISYDIRQRILSPDCGVEQVYSNLDTLFSTYDSLVIDNRDLGLNEINFQVYSF